MKKGKTSNISSDLPLLVLICSYFVIDAFPIARFIFNQWISWLIVGTFFIYLLTSKSQQILLIFKKSNLLLLSIGLFVTTFHLFSIFFFEYGSAYSWNLYRWLRAIPFIFFGLVSASSSKNLYVTSLTIAISNTVSLLINLNYSLAYEVENGISAGRGYHSAALDFDAATSGVRGWAGYQALVYVFILSIGFLLVSPKKPRFSRAIILACVITTSLSIVTSSFLTAFICLMISVLIFVVFNFNTKKFLFSSMLLSLIILGIYVAYQIFISYDIPGFSQILVRLTNVWEGVNGGVGFDLDESGKGRTFLMQISWDSFNSSPLIGVGAYMGQYDKVGGHSNMIDWLAQFGIAGIVGPSAILGYCVYSSFQILKSSSNYLRNLGKSLLCFWLVFIVNTYMGYAFLEPSIDTYSFFAIGLTAGLSQLIYADRLPESIGGDKYQLENTR
jgi:hypothetical protein